MNNKEKFYADRDLRTIEVTGALDFNKFPVHIEIDGRCASSAAGQVALLALVNQVARVHRSATISLPETEIPIVVNLPFSSKTVQTTLLTLMRNIDPYGNFNLSEKKPKNAISLGIGEPKSVCDWYVGAESSIATLDKHPCVFDIKKRGSLRGAALAASLGAATILKMQFGSESVQRRVSAWNFAENEEASPGPDDILPIDVGSVLMVGAGAVGSALIYWLHCFGLGNGSWVILDRDFVALHNTNRSLLFMPSDAGWTDSKPRSKADVCAEFLPNSKPIKNWYHEYAHNIKFDVVLALANEYGVRGSLANKNFNVLLHATTGSGWLSELHRHILGRDDCIQCRMQEFESSPTFGCSTGKIKDEQNKKTSDAALPFLSATSGLMLAVALEKLHRAELHLGRFNNWKFFFNSLYRMSQHTVNNCRDGCSTLLPPETRKQINSKTRWNSLDPG